MTIVFEERLSTSPYVGSVTTGHTIRDGAPTRPAETNWHLVFSKYNGIMHPILVGPWSECGTVTYDAGAEILWIRFQHGVFMPHLPTKKFLNSEQVLPDACCKRFWLHSSTWEIPTYENVECFVDKLVKDGVLVCDPLIDEALNKHVQDISPRTIRHRFAQVTGLSQSQILQVERAQQAATLLRQGHSILDTVYESGYYDQPHLTRSLKKYIGYTPAQLYQP